jgi:hypothetical protein
LRYLWEIWKGSDQLSLKAVGKISANLTLEIPLGDLEGFGPVVIKSIGKNICKFVAWALVRDTLGAKPVKRAKRAPTAAEPGDGPRIKHVDSCRLAPQTNSLAKLWTGPRLVAGK